MLKYKTSYECSSGFCGLMIVACVRVRMFQISRNNAEYMLSHSVAYNKICVLYFEGYEQN